MLGFLCKTFDLIKLLVDQDVRVRHDVVHALRDRVNLLPFPDILHLFTREGITYFLAGTRPAPVNLCLIFRHPGQRFDSSKIFKNCNGCRHSIL